MNLVTNVPAMPDKIIITLSRFPIDAEMLSQDSISIVGAIVFEPSLDRVRRNLGKITNGDFGRKQQKGTIAVMYFTSYGYYEYPYGIEVVNEDKKQEYDKLLNKITTGQYS